jgi:O-antigen/teichoic acid export membrane protein
MIANIGGGALMWAVHFLNKRLETGQYGDFGVFLAVLMLLPNIPLQMVLTQQTAKAIATNTVHELSGVIRMFLLGTGLVWLIGSIVTLYFQKDILDHWKMSDHPAGLWVTIVIVLIALWTPIFWGMLQGQQNFLWLGWSMLANSFGRISVATIAVVILGAGAAGMMAGVLMGFVFALVLAAWQTRSLWLTSAQPFDWRSLMHQVLPLLIAFIGFQILFTGDTIVVKNYFSDKDADFYVSAGTLSRALLWLVLPLASVMFPRLVHSAATSEKSNLMGMVLLGTAILSIVGALGLALVGPLVVRFVYTPAFVKVASSLLPWYAAAMVPLALANVLLNQLLARPIGQTLLASVVFIAAVAYIWALTQFHDSLVTVLKVMGASNLALLAICAAFFLRKKPQAT